MYQVPDIIWGNDLLESHPRLVVGLDFVYGGR